MSGVKLRATVRVTRSSCETSDVIDTDEEMMQPEVRETNLFIEEGETHTSVTVDSDLSRVTHAFIITRRHIRRCLQSACTHNT